MYEEDLVMISRDVFKHLSNSNTDIDRFDKTLSSISTSAFLEYNFTIYPEIYIVHQLMFVYKKYWEVLSLKDWKNIITAIDDHELALITCLSFLYKLVKIDSIELYKSIPNLNEIVRQCVLNCFLERPGMLSVVEKYYLIELKKYGLKKSSFDEIKERFLIEGAKSAKKVPINLINLDS